MSEDKKVGERIRAVRLEADLTQAQVAERMTALGYPMQQQTILKIEKGSRSLKLTEAMALSMALARPIGVLIPDSREREIVQRLRMMAGEVHRRTVSGVDALIDAEIDSRRLAEAIIDLPKEAVPLVPQDVLALAGRTAEQLFERDIKFARERDAEAAQQEVAGG